MRTALFLVSGFLLLFGVPAIAALVLKWKFL